MFYCQATKKLSRANEPARKLVTHVRSKTYFGKPRRRKPRFEDKDSEAPVYTVSDNFQELEGHGWEIVREITVSQEYYNQQMAAGFKPQLVKEKDV
jgi:hypothetical protein